MNVNDGSVLWEDYENDNIHGKDGDRQQQCRRHRSTIHVQDLCSRHGLTGMIFVACNPPGRHVDGVKMTTTCVDRYEPKSHLVLRDIIAEVCPWVAVHGAVSFVTSPLEEFVKTTRNREGPQQSQQQRHTTMATIVVSTHACGSLTDTVLQYASDIHASSIAVMPCCYTGTAKDVPYGIRRMLGVALAADLRRCFVLQEQRDGGYHVDFTAIRYCCGTT